MEGKKTDRKVKVIMVELKCAIEDLPEVLFFGSKKAIFEFFGNKTLKVSYDTLRNYNLAKQPYENVMCRIIQGGLLTLNSTELIERREREGRQPLPTR